MNNMHFKGFLYCSNRRPTSAINGVFALNQVKNGPKLDPKELEIVFLCPQYLFCGKFVLEHRHSEEIVLNEAWKAAQQLILPCRRLKIRRFDSNCSDS